LAKFIFLTRPDGSKIAVDPYFVTVVRPPLKNERGNAVLEPSRQQVVENFDEVVKLLSSDGD
jgi:hypothetical protein